MSSPGADFEQIEEIAAQWVFRREAGLSAEEQSQYAQWLTADPRHQAAVLRLERAWKNLDRPRLSGQADEFLESLRKRKSRRRKVRLTSVAVIVATLLTTVLWVRFPQETVSPGGVVVLAPERRVLEDGSVVELKPGAKIKVNYTAARRQVVLEQGEAHFQVVSQVARPFFVTAGEVEFRAVGTAFSVKWEPAALALIVTHGTVAVETADSVEKEAELGAKTNSSDAPLAMVSAGKTVRVPTEKTERGAELASTSLPAEEVSELLSWRVPRLEFTETPLEKAIDLLNQYNTSKLVIEDRELSELRVSGLFRADRIEAFVRLLEANFGVEATRAESVIVLRKGR